MKNTKNFPGASPLDPANALASPEALGDTPRPPPRAALKAKSRFASKIQELSILNLAVGSILKQVRDPCVGVLTLKRQNHLFQNGFFALTTALKNAMDFKTTRRRFRPM